MPPGPHSPGGIGTAWPWGQLCLLPVVPAAVKRGQSQDGFGGHVHEARGPAPGRWKVLEVFRKLERCLGLDRAVTCCLIYPPVSNTFGMGSDRFSPLPRGLQGSRVLLGVCVSPWGPAVPASNPSAVRADTPLSAPATWSWG